MLPKTEATDPAGKLVDNEKKKKGVGGESLVHVNGSPGIIGSDVPQITRQRIKRVSGRRDSTNPIRQAAFHLWATRTLAGIDGCQCWYGGM